MRIGDQEYNRLRVLKALRRAEPICRTDLARQSALTGGTITEISRDLVRRGLVIEEKSVSGKRGRPRVDLRLNPADHYALGAFIGAYGELECEIVNLKGEQVFEASREMASTVDLRAMSAQVATLIDDVIASAPGRKHEIARVGVALPAVVDSRGGMVHWLQTSDQRPTPVADIISTALGLPVTIDNNTNMLARAEHWFGTDDDPDDFTLLNLGLGISAARFVQGTLMAGAHGLNSELGHAKVMAEGGLPCVCGASGCLDAYCSVSGLARQLCGITGTVMPEFHGMNGLLSDFAGQAREGREDIRAIFDRAARMLGVAMASHVNGFDPGRIVLMCEHPDLPDLLAPSFHAALDANCLPPFRSITRIEFRRYDQDFFRKGAAAMVMEQIYRED